MSDEEKPRAQQEERDKANGASLPAKGDSGLLDPKAVSHVRSVGVAQATSVGHECSCVRVGRRSGAGRVPEEVRVREEASCVRPEENLPHGSHVFSSSSS